MNNVHVIIIIYLDVYGNKDNVNKLYVLHIQQIKNVQMHMIL